MRPEPPDRRPRHGLRREAKRHAAFVRTNRRGTTARLAAPESAVAAGALPAQSKTRLLIEGRDQAVLDKWSRQICEAIKRQVGA